MMNSLLLYLLESSIILSLLYGLYHLLLRQETFFNFNRFFLIAILVFSFLFPLVSFDFLSTGGNAINNQVSELGKVRNAYYTSVEDWTNQNVRSSTQTRSWWRSIWFDGQNLAQVMISIAVVVYILGFTFLLIRFMLVYLRIYRLEKKLTLVNSSGVKVVKLPQAMAPFSFLNTVFIPENIDDESEYNQILAHEKAHVQEGHSFDLIFVQLAAAFIWFNPVIWLLIKSLKQTHEHLADKSMLKQGFSLVEYQSLLLKQLISNNSNGLVNNFNLSFIKKRITMMSIKESGSAGKSKAIIALSLIILVGIMTMQSNTMLGEPKAKVYQRSVGNVSDMQFYIDDILLRDGLQFFKAKDYKGLFKFVFDNDKDDSIDVGLDLVREGQVVANITYKVLENATFSIRSLLNIAQQEDYLVIDILKGPTDASKLYNVPLFRESEGWKKSQFTDLPPPPVALSVDGIIVGMQNALSLTQLNSLGNAQLQYVLSEFVDFGVISGQGGGVTITLLRNEKTIKVIVDDKVKRKGALDLGELLKVARRGDEVMVQFGDPDGLQFGSKFLIQQ